MNEWAALAGQVDALRQSAGIPGAALAVVRDAETVYSAAFGHDADGASLTPDSSFEVASLSKPFFAYAVLKLCEQGIFALDTPISHYLPAPYTADEPRLPFITVRHALCHTSGFPNWRDASGLRCAFDPGTDFNYSTEGLIYLQTAVEAVLGQPFHEYARQHLIQPFGMSQSEYVSADMDKMPAFLPRHPDSFGAISLKTTALDYARFLIEMMRAGATDSFRLTNVTLAEMLTSQIQVADREGLYWGLGWGLQRYDAQSDFWHWGARRTQTCNFAVGSRDQRLGVVILTNHPAGLSICQPIVHAIMQRPSYPALEWLLPAEQWRADGRKPQAATS